MLEVEGFGVKRRQLDLDIRRCNTIMADYNLVQVNNCMRNQSQIGANKKGLNLLRFFLSENNFNSALVVYRVKELIGRKISPLRIIAIKVIFFNNA